MIANSKYKIENTDALGQHSEIFLRKRNMLKEKNIFKREKS